ncbi:STAS domain-containing protein [bacterium]|nr:STAS domain-containing protein [bacterium]MBP9810348.1 STAS domain-containing protein [bacterium]
MAEAKKTRKLEKIRIMGELERGLDDVDKTLATGKTDIELDFSACTFISVDGLEWLEEFLLRADSLKSAVTFVNVQTPVYKVFKVAHIDSLMRACGSPSQDAQGLVC